MDEDQLRSPVQFEKNRLHSNSELFREQSTCELSLKLIPFLIEIFIFGLSLSIKMTSQ